MKRLSYKGHLLVYKRERTGVRQFSSVRGHWDIYYHSALVGSETTLEGAKQWVDEYGERQRGNPSRRLTKAERKATSSKRLKNFTGTVRQNPDGTVVIIGTGPKPPGARTLPNPGTGAFERCVRDVTKKGGSYSPRGVCAAAGRKKYGAKKFAAMARAGKKRARKNPGAYRIVFVGWSNPKNEPLEGYSAWDYLPSGTHSMIFGSRSEASAYLRKHQKGADRYRVKAKFKIEG